MSKDHTHRGKRALSTSQRDKVKRAIEQHEAFSNAYFWTPGGNRRQRERWEDENAWTVAFRHEGVKYSYTSALRVSARNVYYKGYFEVDGERRTVRAFKNLLGTS